MLIGYAAARPTNKTSRRTADPARPRRRPRTHSPRPRILRHHPRDSLVARNIRLQLGTMVYDPSDPMGKMFFSILATFAEFEVDLLRLRFGYGGVAVRRSL